MREFKLDSDISDEYHDSDFQGSYPILPVTTFVFVEWTENRSIAELDLAFDDNVQNVRGVLVQRYFGPFRDIDHLNFHRPLMKGRKLNAWDHLTEVEIIGEHCAVLKK